MPVRHHPSRLLAGAVPLVLAAALAAGLGAGTGSAQSTPAVPSDPAAIEYQPVPPDYDPAGDSLGSTLDDHPEATPAPAEGGVSASAVVGQPLGLDVASYQGNVNWAQVAANQGRFAYVKATEGSPGAGAYTNPYFSQQYNGSAAAGLIRGAYHFALPSLSSGATQAQYFVSNGGGWSADGRTLPPMLDIEFNPYASLGGTCYNLTPAQLRSWVSDFSQTVQRLTGRFPTIYTNTYWWNQCLGTGGTFGQDNPLFVASYFASPYGRTPAVPSQWGFHTIWQWADSGIFPGDQDIFNGSYDQLVTFARGGAGGPVVTPPPVTPPPPAPAPTDFFAVLLALITAFFRSLGFPV